MFLKLLILTLIVWWSGLFGTELYILPLLILVIYTVIKIRKKQLNQSLIDSQNRVYDFFSSLDEKYIYLFIVIQFLIWCLIHFFRYYSFNINTWDAGLHSNILFNISNLDFYSSFLNVNNLGDHFTPLFSIIAIFYAIEPSIHWLMIAKSLSYFFSTLYLYKIVRFHIKGKYSVATAFLFIFGWTYLYSPIIASYKYEFQASALAPPFILYGFYNYHKGKKVLFWLAMFALLGIKEHLGAVWIGFGLYLFCSDPSKKKVESSILIVGGILSIYLIMFHVMPFFRNYAPSWSGLERIVPFKDLNLKVSYIFKLLFPLLFIPLIYWKNGILAGPAIGINLISGMDAMYSAQYHYDDVVSTLLFISTVISLRDIHFEKIYQNIFKNKINQYLLILILTIYMVKLPQSIFRILYKAIPNKRHFTISEELEHFDKRTKNTRIAVLDILGAHIHRKKIEAITQYDNVSCSEKFRNSKTKDLPPPSFAIFAKNLEDAQVKNINKCIEDLEKSKCFTSIKDYSQLIVFKVNKDIPDCKFK